MDVLLFEKSEVPNVFGNESDELYPQNDPMVEMIPSRARRVRVAASRAGRCQAATPGQTQSPAN
jgi:hypothetical protein